MAELPGMSKQGLCHCLTESMWHIECDTCLGICERRKRLISVHFIFLFDNKNVILGHVNHSRKHKEELPALQAAVYLGNTAVVRPNLWILAWVLEASKPWQHRQPCSIIFLSFSHCAAWCYFSLSDTNPNESMFLLCFNTPHDLCLFSLWIIKLWVKFDALLLGIFLQDFPSFPFTLCFSPWMVLVVVLFLWSTLSMILHHRN